MKTKMMVWLPQLPWLLGILFSLFTAGSFLGRWHWSLDLLSHFNAQYTIILLFCTTAGLFLPQRRLYHLLFLFPCVANLALYAPFYLSSPPAVGQPAGTPLKIVNINVYTENEDYDTVLNFVLAEQPDVVFFSEAEPPLIEAINQKVRDQYPYLHDESVRGTLGLAWLSRVPFVQVETVPYQTAAEGRMRRRLIMNTILWEGQEINLYGLHPLPPLNGRWAESRNSEIGQLPEMLGRTTNPIILIGDFNASPWSAPMRQLEEVTHLRHASLGYGLPHTWYYRGVLGAPLDHIYLSADWVVTRYDTSGNVNSDHQPIVMELVLRK